MANQKILVYGSLRKGCYNFEAFKSEYKDEINYIKTTTIKGYSLYSLGAYPGILPGTGELVVDILEVSPRVAQAIYYMEIGAGYEVENVEIGIENYPIYVYKHNVSEDRLVEHGDWVKHVNKKYESVET